ncbi:acyl-CoA dehydrogenase [Candidatus Izemoplasma sp. B36]|uniref:acyl-CoA dehydrogenase n=1 Tax=Candidatus Izemoplasma sp. B36 TaxID=3242468 RepID=UPI003555C16C
MEFGFRKEHHLLKQMLEEFTENEVRPLAQEIDEQERFPVEAVSKMKEAGILGIPFPTKYGGEGGDYMGYIIAVKEISKACATTGVVLSAHGSLCAQPIYDYGTEEQKQKYLVPLASGEKLGAFALTEPNAGTDASKQETIAVKDGDNYIINGSKIFITNAGYADIYVIFAMTDKKQGTRGITAFILEKGMKGFSVGPKEKKMGIRGSSTCELIFDNVIVPKENVLGKEGYGFKIAMKTLDGGRIGIAAQACGIAEGALDETIKYVKERKQFNRPLARFQNTQFVIADLATKIDAAKMLLYRAAYKKDNKENISKEAAMAKLFASEVAMEVTNKAIQLHGGYGYSREYPVERMMRDAKITEIYEGTSEVQKMVISASVLR